MADAATNTPGPATGGGVSAFRAARMEGSLGATPAAPAAPSVPAQQPANDNARAQFEARNQPAVAPGDDESVARQLLEDDDEGIPGLEEAAEAAQPDDETPAADPLEEVLHTDDKGNALKMRDLVESLKNGTIPDALMDKFGWEIAVNGVKQVVSAREMASGYMRQRDYTKKTQEVQSQREENERFQQGFDDACRKAVADRTGKTFRGMMIRMGMMEALYNAAADIAQEEEAISKMPPEAQEYYRKWQREKAAAEARAEQLKMQEESATDKKRRAQQAAFQREYDNLTPHAFQRVGLEKTASSETEYRNALRVILRERGGKLDLEACVAAAQAAKEELADRAVRHDADIQAARRSQTTSPAAAQVAQHQAQRGGQQQPSVRRAAPAPVTGAGHVSGATGGTPRDFRKHLSNLTRR